LLSRLLLLFTISVATGCAPTIPFLNGNFSPKTTPKETVAIALPKDNETKTDKKTNIDPRLTKIASSPSLLANKKNIQAARKAISIVQSQAETQVFSSSNVGPRLDDDNAKLDATTGFTMSKIISDGGALLALTDAANLNVTASQLIYKQSINKQLTEVIKAEQAILNFQKVKSIYDEQLKVYSDNLPLIETAVKANVISKTDALKLEQLKLRSEEAYLTAKTASESSQIVRQKYNLNDSDKFFEINLKKWKSFKNQTSKMTSSNIQLLETQTSILEEDIKAIQASFKANVSLAGNATANVTDFDNSLGFVGLNVSIPVKDGGKRTFEIEEKELQIAGLQQQKEEAILLNATSFKALVNFEKIYNLRSNLLQTQTDNSRAISNDMELKLRAGVASVIDLATENMNFYDLRSQKIALEYQKTNEIIKFYEVIGRECDLTALCDQINDLANF
jgi:outer membrane protein TolC